MDNQYESLAEKLYVFASLGDEILKDLDTVPMPKDKYALHRMRFIQTIVVKTSLQLRPHLKVFEQLNVLDNAPTVTHKKPIGNVKVSPSRLQELKAEADKNIRSSSNTKGLAMMILEDRMNMATKNSTAKSKGKKDDIAQAAEKGGLKQKQHAAFRHPGEIESLGLALNDLHMDYTKYLQELSENPGFSEDADYVLAFEQAMYWNLEFAQRMLTSMDEMALSLSEMVSAASEQFIATRRLLDFSINPKSSVIMEHFASLRGDRKVPTLTAIPNDEGGYSVVISEEKRRVRKGATAKPKAPATPKAKKVIVKKNAPTKEESK